MIDFEDQYFLERKRKADQLRAQGQDPFGGAWDKRADCAAIAAEWEGKATDQKAGVVLRTAGRIRLLRVQGKAAFADIADATGQIQVYIRREDVGEALYDGLVKSLDLGDFIGVEGNPFKTRTGQLTLWAGGLRLLAKALLPPPNKFSGLQETELKYRQRYLDLMANPGTREAFVRRSRIVAGLRESLSRRGFLEVETPMLQSLAGGAAARPFITHHNALDMRLYLRIAPELYLKRLLVGGFEKVFELNRNFRNEGLSPRHNPEFTMLEVYQAYSDGEGMMALTEALIGDALASAGCGRAVDYQGQRIDFSPPFRRLSMEQAVRELGGFQDLDRLQGEELARLLPELSLAEARAVSPAKRLELLFSRYAEPKLVQPTFVTDYPIEISPLAKRKPGAPHLADRFELFICGREIANGFSELNDPLDQYQRFSEQLQARAGGDAEAHVMDEDYVTALMHGMPPAGGMGLGVDRLIMLLTDAASIRDVILFPHMRPKDGEAAAAARPGDFADERR